MDNSELVFFTSLSFSEVTEIITKKFTIRIDGTIDGKANGHLIELHYMNALRGRNPLRPAFYGTIAKHKEGTLEGTIIKGRIWVSRHAIIFPKVIRVMMCIFIIILLVDFLLSGGELAGLILSGVVLSIFFFVALFAEKKDVEYGEEGKTLILHFIEKELLATPLVEYGNSK